VGTIEIGQLLQINTMAPQYLRQDYRRSSKGLLPPRWLPRQCQQDLKHLLHDTQDEIPQRTEITAVKIRIMPEITASQSVRGRGRIRQRLQLLLHELGDKDPQTPKHHIKVLAQEIVGNNQTL
jgi:hypothetical protein